MKSGGRWYASERGEKLQGFVGKVRRKETTWKTEAQMGERG
jgi:hypothetical protein